MLAQTGPNTTTLPSQAVTANTQSTRSVPETVLSNGNAHRNPLSTRYYYYAYFTDEGTEAQRDYRTCTASHNPETTEAGPPEPRQRLQSPHAQQLSYPTFQKEGQKKKKKKAEAQRKKILARNRHMGKQNKMSIRVHCKNDFRPLTCGPCGGAGQWGFPTRLLPPPELLKAFL